MQNLKKIKTYTTFLKQLGHSLNSDSILNYTILKKEKRKINRISPKFYLYLTFNVNNLFVNFQDSKNKILFVKSFGSLGYFAKQRHTQFALLDYSITIRDLLYNTIKTIKVNRQVKVKNTLSKKKSIFLTTNRKCLIIHNAKTAIRVFNIFLVYLTTKQVVLSSKNNNLMTKKIANTTSAALSQFSSSYL
jgi:hypothetical protein